MMPYLRGSCSKPYCKIAGSSSARVSFSVLPCCPRGRKKSYAAVGTLLALLFVQVQLLSLIEGLSTNKSSKRNDFPTTTIVAAANNQRRLFLSKSMALCAGILAPGPSFAQALLPPTNNNNNPGETPEKEIPVVYRLFSGVQFRDVRVGLGPPMTKLNETVVLHLRARTRDGSVLFDTRVDQNGSPLLYGFGSAQDYDYFGGDSSKRSKVTVGVEDAIVSRGTATTSNSGPDGTTALRVEPMREGGIRRVVVPSSLAYGHSGVSRYDAFRMGLRKAVPRDELISYEIELLRCTNIPIEIQPPASDSDPTPDPIETTVNACCTEDNFPCQTPNKE
jgi:hypothetical protein